MTAPITEYDYLIIKPIKFLLNIWLKSPSCL